MKDVLCELFVSAPGMPRSTKPGPPPAVDVRVGRHIRRYVHEALLADGSSNWHRNGSIEPDICGRRAASSKSFVVASATRDTFGVLHIDSVNDFVPAGNKLEAVTRLSALTGAPPETLGPGSKERKSLLVNCSRRLGLDVDESATKPELAESIARQLGMEWSADCWSAGQTITLTGLNRLLSGVHREVGKRKRSAGGTAPRPARSKLEAVVRISSLTQGRPQTLGPGSKERKSVLTDLASGMDLPVDPNLSKPSLAEAIVRELGEGGTQRAGPPARP